MGDGIEKRRITEDNIVHGEVDLGQVVVVEGERETRRLVLGVMREGAENMFDGPGRATTNWLGRLGPASSNLLGTWLLSSRLLCPRRHRPAKNRQEGWLVPGPEVSVLELLTLSGARSLAGSRTRAPKTACSCR